MKWITILALVCACAVGTNEDTTVQFDLSEPQVITETDTHGGTEDLSCERGYWHCLDSETLEVCVNDVMETWLCATVCAASDGCEFDERAGHDKCVCGEQA